MKKLFGLHITVIFLGVTSFLNDLSSEMIYPLLPIFLTQIGATASFIGLLEGIAETTSSLLKLFSGYLSDIIGKKRFLAILGYSISNLARPFIGFSTHPLHVLLLRFTDRVGKGIRTSPRDALIASVTDKDLRGKAFGFHRSMDHLGALAGAGVAFVLLKFLGLKIETIFLLVFIPGLLSIGTLIFGVKEVKEVKIDSLKEKPSFSLKPFDKKFKFYLIILTIFTLGNSSDAFLILKAKEANLSIEQLPLLWMVLHLIKSIFSTPFGIISDKISRRSVIISGWVIYALVYLGFSFAKSPLHIWILFLVYGLYFALTEGAERAYVADLVPEGLRGSAYGIYNFTIGIMALPSSLICGILWENFGSFTALSFGASLAFIASILLYKIK